MSYVKGAPEVILSCTHLSQAERAGWLQTAEEAAVRGERMQRRHLRDDGDGRSSGHCYGDRRQSRLHFARSCGG